MLPVGLLVVVSLLTSLVSGQPTVDSESCTGDSSYQQSLLELLARQNQENSKQIQEILAAMQSHQQQLTLIFTLSGWSAALLLTSKCFISMCVRYSLLLPK
jgi:formate dehydrogenase maturation protein FdhE